MSDPQIKEQRQADPDHRPGHGFLEGDDVALPVKNAKVERQHRQHEDVESDPEPGLINHQF